MQNTRTGPAWTIVDAANRTWHVKPALAYAASDRQAPFLGLLLDEAGTFDHQLV